MNKVILMGRLTRDPDIRYSQGESSLCVARYTLAVNRKYAKEGEQSADFIRCIAFGTQAENAEKYFKQGTKLVITGHIQTGSYTNKDGQKVYTTDIVIEDQEFAESKSSQLNHDESSSPVVGEDGFMNIPDGVDDIDLPFN